MSSKLRGLCLGCYSTQPGGKLNACVGYYITENKGGRVDFCEEHRPKDAVVCWICYELVEFDDDRAYIADIPEVLPGPIVRAAHMDCLETHLAEQGIYPTK